MTIANLRTSGLSQLVADLLHRSLVRIQAVHLDTPCYRLLFEKSRADPDIRHTGTRIESPCDESQTGETTGEALNPFVLKEIPNYVTF